MADWKAKALANSAVVGPDTDWRKRALEQSTVARDIFDDGPSEKDVDRSEDAPAMVRLQVGALDKPEDRLKALQKIYPDARPYGDNGNFIYTDENGKVRQYNQESWFPSLGDFASIAPEAGETVGSVAGGILGGIGGSVLPVAGTTAGAIGGAGVGGTAGREATQRGLNYIFGNEDTRTTGDQLKDAGMTFALNAGGEGLGRALGAGVKAGKNAWTGHVIGEADDPAKVAERLADWKKIGVEPTAGMVSGNNKTSLLEHALIPTRSGNEINKRVGDAFSAQQDEFGRIIQGMSYRPLSKAEAGEALQKQAELAKQQALQRSDQLYTEAGKKITSPAVVDRTSDFLKSLEADRAGMGEFDKLTKGAATDSVISTARAIVADAQSGMSFDQLKAARTHIGSLAADSEDRVLKNHLNGLYASLTDDMEKTAVASGDDALQSFRKANNHFRRFADDERGFGKNSVADNLIKKPTDDILNWSLNGVKNGGNKIATVRRTIQKSEGGQEAWGQVIAGITDRLGRGSDDAFDPGTFMRNWNKMAPEAKSALFNGTQHAQYKNDLDALSRISDNWTKYRKNANHSNTENHAAVKDSLNPFSKNNAIASFLGLAATAEPVTAMALGAAKGGFTRGASMMSQASRAKLLTNADTVNWMANLPKAELQKGGFAGHVKKLVGIARGSKDNAMTAAIDEYLKSIGYQNDNE